MADIFISYSRKDREFVVRLNQALQKREYDVWVDLEDIPPTADWMEEVRSGIEGSDAYVFVISPDSIVSKVCQEELAHAVEHNKRLVPIVCREVDPDTVSQPLRARNWIFFSDGAAFDEGFQELVDAFSTDLDWLHEHTRLLTRAIEWDKSGRDNSFALRGSDLRTAEEWQARATEKEPKLTPLQTEYILASRKTATRRQRITLGAVTFGLIVALVLGIVALWQWTAAERQAKIALGRQLAAQAQLTASQGPQSLQQSVLLAAEAEKQSPLHSAEAERILRQGLDLLPRPVLTLAYEDEPDIVEMDYGGSHRMGKAVFSPDGKYLAATNAGKTAQVWDPVKDREIATITHGTRMQDVLFSSDGKYLATSSDDNTIRVWNASDGAEVSRLDHEDAWNIDFSPDGRYLATAGSGLDSPVRVWDPDSGDEVATVNQEGPALGIAFSPDAQLLAVANASVVGLWDPSNGEQVGSLEYGEGSPTDLAFSPDGKYLAAASGINTGDTTATVWEVASREQVTRVSHQGSILDVEFSPYEGYFATASDDGTARLWEVSSQEEVMRVDHGDLVSSVDFSPDGRYLATASYDNTARVWDLMSGGEEVARMIHRDTVKEAVFSPDGRYLATASSDNTTRMWAPFSSHEFEQIVHEDVNALALSRDGRYLATAGWDKTARIWDPLSGEELASMNHGANVMDVAFSPDGKYLATAGVDNTARLWSLDGGAEVARMSHGSSVDDLEFSPDGRYLATASTDNTVRLWNPGSGEEIARFAYGEFETSDPGGPGSEFLQSGGIQVAFSPNGEYLAAANRLADEGDTARVWSVADHQEVARVSHEGPVSDVVFSPDGEHFATASDDKTARVWKTVGGEGVASMSHEARVGDVEFSPDGEYLATASTDNTARLWRVAGGDELSRMTHEGLVYRAAFSANGDYLITASTDGTARVWSVPGGSEVASMNHGPFGSIADAAFGPEGGYLVTINQADFEAAPAHRIHRIWLWRPPDALVKEACARLTRNFTRAEWEQNLPAEEYRKTCPGLPESASPGIAELQDEAGSQQSATRNAFTSQEETAPEQTASQNAEAPVEEPSSDGPPAAGNRGEDASGSSSGYNRIETPDGSLAAEVPQSWGVETGEDSEKEGGPNTWSFHAGEYLASSITTAPNLDAWYSTGTSGAYFVASRALAQRYTDYELTNSLFNAPKNESCAEAGPYDDYDRPPYSGKLQTWYGCGEDGATVYTLAASPEGRECVVALSARVSEEADREAIEHLIGTFEVDCGGVA